MDRQLVKKLIFRGVPPLAVIGITLYYTYFVGSNADKLRKEKERLQQVEEVEESFTPTEDISSNILLPAEKKEDAPAVSVPQEPGPETETQAVTFEQVFKGEIWSQAAPEEWMRRFIVFADEIGNGFIPLRSCAHLRSEVPFSAERVGGAWKVSGQCAGRYRKYVDILCAVDVKGAVDYYMASRGVLDKMLAALGYGGVDCDGISRQALEVLAGMPVPVEEPELDRIDDTHYSWKDEKLERLSPVRKMCLRMGVENAARIRDKAKEFSVELEKRLAEMHKTE